MHHADEFKNDRLMKWFRALGQGRRNPSSSTMDSNDYMEAIRRFATRYAFDEPEIFQATPWFVPHSMVQYLERMPMPSKGAKLRPVDYEFLEGYWTTGRGFSFATADNRMNTRLYVAFYLSPSRCAILPAAESVDNQNWVDLEQADIARFEAFLHPLQAIVKNAGQIVRKERLRQRYRKGPYRQGIRPIETFNVLRFGLEDEEDRRESARAKDRPAEGYAVAPHWRNWCWAWQLFKDGYGLILRRPSNVANYDGPPDWERPILPPFPPPSERLDLNRVCRQPKHL